MTCADNIPRGGICKIAAHRISQDVAQSMHNLKLHKLITQGISLNKSTSVTYEKNLKSLSSTTHIFETCIHFAWYCAIQREL